MGVKDKVIPEFWGEVKNGQLFFENRERFDKYLGGLTGKVKVVVRKWRKNRSLNQNSYYWGVVIKILAEELGYTDEQCHNALKWEFLRVEGKRIPTIKSTALLTTLEFMDFIDKIQIWAAQELNINIPSPNEIDISQLTER